MAWWLAFVGSVVVANALVLWLGVIPVGLGLMAPAGVVVVGLSFWLRDRLHLALGWPGVLSALLVGGVISALASPALAVASVSAFLASETLDGLVFQSLRRRYVLAVLASNVVGLIVDSLVFLSLAFGSLAYLPGQVWGKAWWTIAFLAWRSGTRLARQD